MKPTITITQWHWHCNVRPEVWSGHPLLKKMIRVEKIATSWILYWLSKKKTNSVYWPKHRSANHVYEPSVSSCFPHKVLVFLHSQSLSVQISCQVINLHEAQVHSGHSGLFYFKGVSTKVYSRTVPSLEVPAVPGGDRTGPGDPEGPGSKKSRDLKFGKVPGNGWIP